MTAYPALISIKHYTNSRSTALKQQENTPDSSPKIGLKTASMLHLHVVYPSAESSVLVTLPEIFFAQTSIQIIAIEQQENIALPSPKNKSGTTSLLRLHSRQPSPKDRGFDNFRAPSFSQGIQTVSPKTTGKYTWLLPQKRLTTHYSSGSVFSTTATNWGRFRSGKHTLDENFNLLYTTTGQLINQTTKTCRFLPQKPPAIRCQQGFHFYIINN